MFLKQSLNANTNSITTSFIQFSLVLFFLLDVLNGVCFYYGFEWILSPSSLPKLLWELILLGFIVLKLKDLSKIELGVLIFSAFLFLIGALKYFENLDNPFWGIKHLNKLFLYFYFFIFLSKYKFNHSKIYFVFDWIFVVNSVFIWLGFFFDIEFMKSYPFSDRFGYSGIFARMSINDVSLFYLIANFYLFYRWKGNETDLWKFVVVFLASFLVGTKAIYLQNVLFMIFVFVLIKEARKIIFICGLSAGIALLSLCNFSFWSQLYQDRGLLSVITSTRSDLFIERIPNALNEIDMRSFLFGLQNPFQYYTEMDIIDLFLTVGLLGTIGVAFFYKSIFFTFRKTNHFAWTFIAVYLLMICISGRYMYSGVNAIYFPLFLFFLVQKEHTSIN